MRLIIAAVFCGLCLVGSVSACDQPQNLVLQDVGCYQQPQAVRLIQAQPIVYRQNVQAVRVQKQRQQNVLLLQDNYGAQNVLAVQQKGRQLNVQSAGGLNNLRIRQRGLFGRKLDIRAN